MFDCPAKRKTRTGSAAMSERQRKVALIVKMKEGILGENFFNHFCGFNAGETHVEALEFL
jgi:hypothetical protein